MKTFLSECIIDYEAALRRHLDNPYKLHQFIWDSLPVDADAKRDFLFRSDIVSGKMKVLLLSSRSPQARGSVEWRTTEVPDSFFEHATYRFRLKANPTFRRSADHRRLAIFDEVKIREWFNRKLSAAGCEVMSLETEAPQKKRFRKTAREREMAVCTVDASGIISVSDSAKFRAVFDTGIGSAKGFGLGLLMLQPVQF